MIRIVCANISRSDERIYKSLYEGASDERKRRADRYLRYEDKLRCVTADALLRAALGTNEYQIEKNESGKPYVKDRKDFYYNLSHSGDYVVLAFGNSEIGVDVQRHSAGTDMRAVADHCFSPDEKEYLLQGGEYMKERFYELWTGKESYLKCVGKGLYGDVRNLSVLKQKSEILFFPHLPKDGYSLSLCTKDTEYIFELSDVRQLG